MENRRSKQQAVVSDYVDSEAANIQGVIYLLILLF